MAMQLLINLINTSHVMIVIIYNCRFHYGVTISIFFPCIHNFSITTSRQHTHLRFSICFVLCRFEICSLTFFIFFWFETDQSTFIQLITFQIRSIIFAIYYCTTKVCVIIKHIGFLYGNGRI